MASDGPVQILDKEGGNGTHRPVALEEHGSDAKGEITLEYKKTQEMIADGLNKLQGLIAFKDFVKYLGLVTEAEAEQN